MRSPGHHHTRASSSSPTFFKPSAPPSIHAVLFDLDGTLLDGERNFRCAANKMLQERGKPPVEECMFRRRQSSLEEMMRHAFEIDDNHPELPNLVKSFDQKYREDYRTQGFCLFENTETILNTLKNAGIPWGIVTNKPSDTTYEVVNRSPLLKTARIIVPGDLLERKKPDPLPLLYACKQLNVSPENTFYVGDMKTDIIAAQNADMRSIAVTHGYHPEYENPHSWGATYVVPDFNALQILLENLLSSEYRAVSTNHVQLS